MICNAKVLSLAVGAALALTGLVASAASAASFHAEKSPSTITGSQTATHTLTTDYGLVACTTATFYGETSGLTTTQQTITPTYSSCTLATIFGSIAVTVNLNGCDYLFTANGEAHINCPAGANVVLSSPGCTLTFPPQTIENAVQYTSAGAGTTRDLIAHMTVKNGAGNNGLDYSYSGFGCGSGSGTTNGTYIGNTTLTGSTGGVGHVGIWWTA
jgi:hypothetical protein